MPVTSPNTPTIHQKRAERKAIALYEAKRRHDAQERHNGLVLWCISHRRKLQNLKIVKVFPGMIQVKNAGRGEQPPQLVGVQRGTITGFSAASRKRMIEKTMKMRLTGKRTYFITLTYPKEFPLDFQTWKRHIDTWLKRVKRKFPAAFGLWRLEPQERLAPHFHVLLIGADVDIDDMINFVTKSWAEIAHTEDQYEGKYATNVKAVFGRKHALYYITKYAAKVPDHKLAWGRCWGSFNKPDCTPMAVFGWDRLTEKKARQAALALLYVRGNRYAANFADLPSYMGWSLFGVGEQGEAGNRIIEYDEFMSIAFNLERIEQLIISPHEGEI